MAIVIEFLKKTTIMENPSQFMKILEKDSYSISHDYLIKGKMAIDSQFGEGYAEKHPELVEKFMLSSSLNLIALGLLEFGRKNTAPKY